MRRRLSSVFFGALLTLSAPLVDAQEKKPPIPFQKYELANGLELIVVEDSRLPLVSVDMWYHVGAVNEDRGKSGFAHLFEHVMFQGSKHVEEDTFFKYLESAGASQINGSTTFDRTNYFETVPSNQLELALWLESDRMGFLLDTLTQERLDGQREVVRNERRQRYENTPYGSAMEKIFQAIFPSEHPYYNLVIGSHKELQAASLDDVRSFFVQYYAPNNATLTIVGDVKAEKAKELVEKYFGEIPKGTEPKEPVVPSPNKLTEAKVLPVLEDNVSLPRLYYAWATPASYKPGDAEAEMMSRVLAGGKSSRLYKRLVYQDKIAQDVASYQWSTKTSSVFVVYATAKPGVTTEQLEKAINEELDALLKSPVSEDELTRVKRGFEVEFLKGLEGLLPRAEILQQYNHFLGNPDMLEQDLARYKKASAADLQKFVQDYLKPTARVSLVVAPKKK